MTKKRNSHASASSLNSIAKITGWNYNRVRKTFPYTMQAVKFVTLLAIIGWKMLDQYTTGKEAEEVKKYLNISNIPQYRNPK